MNRAHTTVLAFSAALGGASTQAVTAWADPARAPAPGAARLVPLVPLVVPSSAPPEIVSPPLREPVPDTGGEQEHLEWRSEWRTVGVREYVTTGALAAASLGEYLLLSRPTSARWDSPILFDDHLRGFLRLQHPSERRAATYVSDGVLVAVLAHAFIVDPVVLAWARHDAPFVAWQMFVINAQSYALTTAITGIIKRATARARPWVAENCGEEPSAEHCDSSQRFVSFTSGHAANSAAAAGLVCAHHGQLALYGSATLDAAACGLAVAGTLVTSTLRVMSDNHWVSDVLVGDLIGFGTGFVLPSLYYYRKAARAGPGAEPALVYTFLPMAGPNLLGLGVLGLF